jgi:hypothetical protein
MSEPFRAPDSIQPWQAPLPGAAQFLDQSTVPMALPHRPAQTAFSPWHIQPHPQTYRPQPAPTWQYLARPGYVAAPTGFTAYVPIAGGRSRRRLTLCAGALSTLIVGVLLALGLGAPGFFVTRQLDVHKAEAGVQQVLVDSKGYGAKNVSRVTCNDGQSPTIKKGDSFLCEANIAGVNWLFAVTFKDDAGTYEVGYPH